MFFELAGLGLGLGQMGMGIMGQQRQGRAARKARQEARAAQAAARREIGLFGQAARGNIDRSAAQERGEMTGLAIDRGLGNTSVLDTLRNMAAERAMRQRMELDADIAQRMAGVAMAVQPMGPDAAASRAAGEAVGAGLEGSLRSLGGLFRSGGQPTVNPSAMTQAQNWLTSGQTFQASGAGAMGGNLFRGVGGAGGLGGSSRLASGRANNNLLTRFH